jgi:hypothetical protein
VVVAFVALLLGVSSRYHGSAAGHALLGYWVETPPLRPRRRPTAR